MWYSRKVVVIETVAGFGLWLLPREMGRGHRYLGVDIDCTVLQFLSFLGIAQPGRFGGGGVLCWIEETIQLSSFASWLDLCVGRCAPLHDRHTISRAGSTFGSRFHGLPCGCLAAGNCLDLRSIACALAGRRLLVRLIVVISAVTSPSGRGRVLGPGEGNTRCQETCI